MSVIVNNNRSERVRIDEKLVKDKMQLYTNYQSQLIHQTTQAIPQSFEKSYLLSNDNRIWLDYSTSSTPSGDPIPQYEGTITVQKEFNKVISVNLPKYNIPDTSKNLNDTNYKNYYSFHIYEENENNLWLIIERSLVKSKSAQQYWYYYTFYKINIFDNEIIFSEPLITEIFLPDKLDENDQEDTKLYKSDPRHFIILNNEIYCPIYKRSIINGHSYIKYGIVTYNL